MSKFDTHGGVFAPQGYMRVNAGGSHEENPNGGVQVGVDPEGVPNVLEEGEPVYNDYVYSDNIVAEKEILEKHNIPVKYAGKLYSVIADTMVDAVAEMPLDPIANNGLEEMLVRLADAQEEQKAIEQQKELEKELESMSPEELAELEALLSEQEQVPIETPMMNTPVQEMPQGLMMKCGGKINRYDWGSFLNQVRNYTGSRARSTDRHYRIDPNFYKRYGFNSIEDLENSEPYKAFTRYVLANSNNPEVLDYLRAIDSGVAQGNNVPLLFDENGNLRNDWHDQYIRLRNDQKGGIYHFMGDTADDFQGLSRGTSIAPVTNRYVSSLGTPNGAVGDPAGVYLDSTPVPHTNPVGLTTYNPSRFVGISTEQPDLSNLGIRPGVPVTGAAGPSGLVSAPGAVDANGNSVGPVTTESARALPTWPRYAKALTTAGLGIYNAFQDPYEWNVPRVNPVLPYGRMHLVDPVYNPLDQNQVTNDVLASGAGNARTMLYAAPGSSLPSMLLAHDYNVGRNMGNAATAVWDANNQRRNAVIAAHNQNAGTLGNFHYGQNRDRAQILNDFAWRNAHNDLMRQRLAYEDEAARYQAVGNQINAVADALAGIGRENFAMNQLNSNTAFDYGVRRNGWGYYQGLPYYAACGGKMKKK